MVGEGFLPLMPFEPFNKMGFVEVAKNIFFFLNAKKKLIQYLKDLRPDCLICVDYPGLNFSMMKAAHKLGIPVVWYIAPMVWAWKKKRAAVLGKYASHICCLFPFEVQYFKPYTSKVSFVGNPLVEAIERETVSLKNKKTFQIAIVPGSRQQEIEKLLLPMVGAVDKIIKQFPHFSARVSYCKHLDRSCFSGAVQGTGIELYEGSLRQLLRESDLAIVTSGTATLEAALLGVPMVVAYKTAYINYLIFKSFIQIPYISLPNIIAGKKIIPECIQDDVTVEALAEELSKYISDKSYYTFTKENLNALREQLGGLKPSVEIPEIIAKQLNH